MNQISGTYRNGAVFPNEPVDWPDGTPVRVTCEAARDDVSEVCIDGSVWDDSPEGLKEWCDWFNAQEPLFTGEELTRFEDDLRFCREEQSAIVPAWHKRIADLSR